MDAKEFHHKLATDTPTYCKYVLKVVDKSGKLVPMQLNKAQQFIHENLEAQLKETGMVRALILKGRQQGASTYITARYFHKSQTKPHTNVYILSHLASSTQTLFRKVQQYHQGLPEPMKQTPDIENRRQLQFKNKSMYSVGTAGSGGVGRGDTTHLFHGSEVAYYPATEDIAAGALQAVADLPGTEVILESTANGIGGLFYDYVLDALSNPHSKWRLIFVPWYWQDEYKRTPPKEWKPTQDEQELANLYGLTREQLYWRRVKIDSDLRSEKVFQQEYPCTPQEAFVSSGGKLLDPQTIEAARKAVDTEDTVAPLILGVDAARNGDRTVLAYRKGRVVQEVEVFENMDEMRLAGIVADRINTRKVDKVFMDKAFAYGAIDRLKELGYGHYVVGVHFGAAAKNNQFLNKRAEMAANLRDWLADPPVRLPDRDDIAMDLLLVPDFDVTSNSRLKLPAKLEIKKELGMSPDIFDAIILTFAQPVLSTFQKEQNTIRMGSYAKRKSPLQITTAKIKQGMIQ